MPTAPIYITRDITSAAFITSPLETDLVRSQSTATKPHPAEAGQCFRSASMAPWGLAIGHGWSTKMASAPYQENTGLVWTGFIGWPRIQSRFGSISEPRMGELDLLFIRDLQSQALIKSTRWQVEHTQVKDLFRHDLAYFSFLRTVHGNHCLQHWWMTLQEPWVLQNFRRLFAGLAVSFFRGYVRLAVLLYFTKLSRSFDFFVFWRLGLTVEEVKMFHTLKEKR